MRYRAAAAAMAVTEDKARAVGPFHSPKQNHS